MRLRRLPRSFVVGVACGVLLTVLMPLLLAQDAKTTVKITEPEAKKDAKLQSRDGVYLLQVKGESKGVDWDSMRLLLYVNAHKGPPGWYLQLPPRGGVPELEDDGKWKGTCQLGNEQWPPSEDDPAFDVGVVVMAKGDADDAMAKAKKAPDKPLTELPEGIARHKVEGLKASMPD